MGYGMKYELNRRMMCKFEEWIWLMDCEEIILMGDELHSDEHCFIRTTTKSGLEVGWMYNLNSVTPFIVNDGVMREMKLKG